MKRSAPLEDISFGLDTFLWPFKPPHAVEDPAVLMHNDHRSISSEWNGWQPTRMYERTHVNYPINFPFFIQNVAFSFCKSIHSEWGTLS